MATIHHRNSSHPKRPQVTHARLSRLSGTSKHPNPAPVLKSAIKSTSSKADVSDDDIMTSFPQYCTYCEKQIVVPSQSILYCSERCRKRDSNKPLSDSSIYSDKTPPASPHARLSFEHLPAHDIVPQRSPTGLNNHRFSAHFDLVEDIPTPSDQSHGLGIVRVESEAARYLRQFHNTSATDLVSMSSRRSSRPRLNRSSTSIGGMSTGAPSLSQSPSSTDGTPFPFTPSTRPLPPRANPFSCSSCGAKSSDLVNPFAVVPQITRTAPSSLDQQNAYSLKTRPLSQIYTEFPVAEFMYEKSAISPTSGTGSLKQLFSFSEMQAPPTEAELFFSEKAS